MFDFISNLFSRKNRQLPVRTLETIKPACKVCFIDDKNFNRVIDILKRDGWTNVSRIKDVEAFLNPKATNEESSNLYENMYESFHALMTVVDDIKKGQ